MLELYILNQNVQMQPELKGDITWTTERRNAPGKLQFSVVKDNKLNFQEGNQVTFLKDGKPLFLGYVWEKSRNKEQIITVTAYDQMRYLKYKDTYVYKVKKANEVISMIAKDYNLKTGELSNTGYVIQKRLKDNQTLLDIIYDSLDLTFDNTKKIYTLYDDYGRLVLKDMESMRLDTVVDYDTTQDFSYKTTLDDVYNQIKLVKENKKSGKRDVFITKNTERQNQWGKLQYYEKVNEKTNAKAKADALLELYCKVNRKLSVQNAIGDIRVRGGSSVLVNFKDIGDISIKNYMLVEKVTHKFSNDEHWMNLEVRGRM